MCEVLCYKVVQRKDGVCEVLSYNGRFKDYRGLYGTSQAPQAHE